jgi:hypothetical protein
MEHTTIAVDLAKSVFQVTVSHHAGHIDEERLLSRTRFLTYVAARPPATISSKPAARRITGPGSSSHSATPFVSCRRTMSSLCASGTRPIARRPERCSKRSKCEIGAVPIAKLVSMGDTILELYRIDFLMGIRSDMERPMSMSW